MIKDDLMKFIKVNKYILILALIFIVFFYWTELRPVEIKKECFKFAVGKNKGAAKDSRWHFLEEDYQFCIKEKGLQ